MRARQRGVTLLGLIMGSFVLVVVALLAMRLLPSYIEYFSIKKAVLGIAKEREASPNDLRRAFENRSAIDDFQAVKSKDLEISKQGNGYLITAQYRKEVPLFANIGIYIDFDVSSQ